MKPPVLLTYNLEGETARKIRFLAMRLKIRVCAVESQKFGQSLGSLCGLEAAVPEAYQGPGFSDEMLVMAHFPPGLIHQFLNGLRTMKIKPIGLKAVLTDTNRSWNSVFLHQELCKERQAVANGLTSAHQGKET